MTPETALQTAVVAALLADTAVAGFVGDRVRDEVPYEQDPVTPYAYIGPISRTRVEASDPTDEAGNPLEPVWAIRMRLYAVSEDFGRLEAWDVADAIAVALEGKEPVLPGGFQLLDRLQAVQLGDVIEPLNPKSVFIDITAMIGRV